MDPEFGPPAPLDAPPIWTAFRPPGWLTSDWPLVGLGVAVMLALLFAVAALYGMIAGVATSGNLSAAPYGAALGSHLAFAAFGARTAVSFGTRNGSALALQFLPLPWAVAGGLAMRAALRFARPRLPDQRRRRVGYIVKLAVAGGVALGVLAGLLDQRSQAGSGYRSELNGGEVWFYATVLLLLWGGLWLHREGHRLVPAPPADVRPLAQPASEGAMAFVAMAVAFAFVGLVFGLIVVDRNGAQVGLLFGVPVLGLSFGAAMADFAMGAALGLGSLFGQPVGHVSLAHFGLPPAADAGTAPVWLFVVLLVAPAAVAAIVWRRLERQRPTQEQDALGVGAATAAGFAAAAWLFALVGRIALLAAIAPPGSQGQSANALSLLRGRGAGIGTLVAAQPNPVSVAFLAFLWGLAGGLGAAFLWASRHNARWQVTTADGTAPPPASSPPASSPPAAPPPGDAPTSPAPPTSGESAWPLPEPEAAPTAVASPLPPSQGAPGAPPGHGTRGPLEDAPTEPAGSGPASGEQSAAGAPSERGSGSGGRAAEAVASEENVGEVAGAAADAPQESGQEDAGAEEPPEEKP
ncbi:MAG: hypothetical protein LC792_19130 [Actinobacteria bacterium]|nr:hypothetical protein [Actinomycetota bacterium]